MCGTTNETRGRRRERETETDRQTDRQTDRRERVKRESENSRQCVFVICVTVAGAKGPRGIYKEEKECYITHVPLLPPATVTLH